MRLSRNYFFNIPAWIFLYASSLLLLSLGKFYPDNSIILARYIKSPFVNFRYFIYEYIPNSFDNFFYTSYKISQLQDEKQKLEEDFFYLSAERFRLHVLEKENKDLKTLLNYKNNFLRGASDIIITKISISNVNSNSFNKEIILNAGTNEKIKPGNLVVSINGIVGYIKDVYSTHSTILTSLDSDFRISATASESNINLVIVGNGTSFPDVNVYYENNPIKNNELLFTSGLEGQFPAGIPIGKLIQDSKNVIKVALLEDFSTLNYVYIIK